MITQSTIDSIFQATRVEEVIGDFVQLKKSGANYKGLSPFTDERTPSFTISPAKQIWKDFSSGKGGTAVSFLMEHEHYSYPEALRYLARKYNIEIEETQQSQEEAEQADKRASMYLINQYATEQFIDNLWNIEKGKAIGLSYYRERGLTDETIRSFELGYCLNQWDVFTQKALKEGHNIELLSEVGLTIIKEEKRFDRFKGRVMFPIHSMSGRILGFGGRTLSTDKKVAKYVNSPESDIYHKSHILYGIHQAKQQIAKEDNCYLVEGYTDVIQLYQSGIKNVVASGGTSLTREQIRLIRRLTPNITILYDGDAAGQRASLRGIDMILENEMNVRVCSFPEGEDPDSFARRHQLEDIIDYLAQHTTDFIAYKAKLLHSQSLDDPALRAEAIGDIVISISKIQDPIKRELYLRKCAEIINISEGVLFNRLAQITKKEDITSQRYSSSKTPMQVSKSESRLKDIDQQTLLERTIIKIILLYGNMEICFEDTILQSDIKGNLITKKTSLNKRVFDKIYADLQQDEITFANDAFRTIFEQITHIYIKNGELNTTVLLQNIPTDFAETVASIELEDEKYQLSDWERKGILVTPKPNSVAQLIQETILDFRLLMIAKLIDKLQQQTTDPRADHTKLLDEVIAYKQLENKLSYTFNRRIV